MGFLKTEQIRVDRDIYNDDLDSNEGNIYLMGLFEKYCQNLLTLHVNTTSEETKREIEKRLLGEL